MEAQDHLSAGSLDEALAQLQGKVRSDPSNVNYRVFLFQLLAVMGQWDRALTQLNVAGELDATTLSMVQTYREALLCEGLRTEVFAGRRSPLIFGKPEQWIALLIESLRLLSEGKNTQAQDVRDQAFELAPATTGHIEQPDGTGNETFEWIADADSRLGPILETIINGRYYWVPFHRIQSINIEAPTDLRDTVWMPAYFTWANGGESVGLIPTRYSGSEKNEDNQIRSAHKTIWQDLGNGIYQGLGQRILTTDSGDYSLMDLRLISLNTQSEETESKTSVAEHPEPSSVLELD